MTRRTDFRPPTRRAAAIAALFSLLTVVALAMPTIALFQDDQESQPLSGVFTVTITRGDIPPNLAGGPALAGLWNVTFSGDGSFSLARQDVGEVVTGRFEAAAATLTFNEWSGLVGCDITADSGETATYAWQQTDDRLTLTPITDSCTERLTLLTTRPLGGFEACAVSPRSLVDPFATGFCPAGPGHARRHGGDRDRRCGAGGSQRGGRCGRGDRQPVAPGERLLGHGRSDSLPGVA